MIEIPLTQGKVALVDDEDYPIVSRHKWSAHCDNSGHWTARARERGTGRPIRMHQLLFGQGVDHVNRNPLDNRRRNIRQANSNQQAANRGPKEGRKYKGVRQEKRWRGQRWYAKLCVRGIDRHLGTFDTPEAAARAYDKAAYAAWGEYAYLNFPKEIVNA